MRSLPVHPTRRFDGKRSLSGHRRRGGFSLPEVTIAVGIVAAVVLPTLALLATGSRLSRVSVDQELGARLARDVASRVRLAADAGGFEFVPDGGSPPIPLPAEGSWHAAFSGQGEFLGEAAPGEYQEGLSPESGAAHLLALRLDRVDLAAGLQQVEVSLYRLEISAEAPAAAPLRSREKLIFPTRLAGP